MSDCTTAISLASRPPFRFQTYPVEGDKPFTQAFKIWERDAWEQWQSYVQSQFHQWALTSKPQVPWTDPLMSATDCDGEEAGERDGLTGMKPKLEQDEEGWAILPVMGNHSLEDCKHIIRDYITQIYHKQPSTWMELYTGLTLDLVQNVIARTQGLMCIGKRWQNPPRLSSGWKISLRGSIY